MANTARKPLSPAAVRAIAIRKSIARRAANDTQTVANDNGGKRRGMNPRLLAMCVDAGGFDQNARFA